MRQTLSVPSGGSSTLAGKQILYQSGVTLPPGRFGVKVVVRENESGLTGSFEAPIVVPELKQKPLKLSSVVLSTQVQPAPRGASDNPLIRDGLQLLPNVTHVVSRDQKLLFYFEVYDPSEAAGSGTDPDVFESAAAWRNRLRKRLNRWCSMWPSCTMRLRASWPSRPPAANKSNAR